MMERVLGPLPQHMLRRAGRHAEKYVRGGRLYWLEGGNSRESIRVVSKLLRLQNLVMEHVDHLVGDLIDLLHGLLKHEELFKYLKVLHGLLKHEELFKYLKVFASFNEELFKEITQLLTLENFSSKDNFSF